MVLFLSNVSKKLWGFGWLVAITYAEQSPIFSLNHASDAFNTLVKKYQMLDRYIHFKQLNMTAKSA